MFQRILPVVIQLKLAAMARNTFVFSVINAGNNKIS